MKLYSKILGYVLLLCYCFFTGGFGNILQRSNAPAACTISGKKPVAADGTTSISGKADQVQWSLKIKYTGGEPCFLPACYLVAPGRALFYSNDDISSHTGSRTASAGLVTLTLRGPPAAPAA